MEGVFIHKTADMNSAFIYGSTLPDVYNKTLWAVWHNGEPVYIENYQCWTREMTTYLEIENPTSDPQIILPL